MSVPEWGDRYGELTMPLGDHTGLSCLDVLSGLPYILLAGRDLLVHPGH